MALPFDLSLPQVVLGGLTVGVGAVRLLGPKVLDWWRKSRQDQRNRVRKWHREMQRHLFNVRSVGIWVQTGRRVGVDEVERLTPTAVEMESEVNPEPVDVKSLVDDDVRATVRQAIGLVYHFTHLPQLEEDEDSMAGVMRHQYQILQEIDHYKRCIYISKMKKDSEPFFRKPVEGFEPERDGRLPVGRRCDSQGSNPLDALRSRWRSNRRAGEGI